MYLSCLTFTKYLTFLCQTHFSAKQQTIQQIIDNLHISTLEYRNESDHDVSPYVHDRKIELIQVCVDSQYFSILAFVQCTILLYG